MMTASSIRKKYISFHFHSDQRVRRVLEFLKIISTRAIFEILRCETFLRRAQKTIVFVQAFNLDAPQQLEEKGIEAAILFGNIGEIIEISDRSLEIWIG